MVRIDDFVEQNVDVRWISGTCTWITVASAVCDFNHVVAFTVRVEVSALGVRQRRLVGVFGHVGVVFVVVGRVLDDVGRGRASNGNHWCGHDGGPFVVHCNGDLHYDLCGRWGVA